MAHDIRRLTAADAGIFRPLRLESLERHPEAFGASFEEEAALPIEEAAERLETHAVFGGFDGPALVGMAGFYVLDRHKTRHRGALWGVYVQEQARGQGLAGGLVARVLEHAKSEVELVQLVVETTNEPARKLYEGLGFEQYGLERRALKIGDRSVDAALMVRFLD